MEGGAMNLNSVLIGSEEPKRLAEYYTKLFGDPGWDMDGYVGWQVGSGGFTVGPHDQVRGKNGEPGRIIWNIETPDVKAEFDRFVAAGAIVVREPYDPGEGSGYAICTFADPDDNYFQLVSPMEME
jgi:predicted enzyme related to lactoylglutathione lyase